MTVDWLLQILSGTNPSNNNNNYNNNFNGGSSNHNFNNNNNNRDQIPAEATKGTGPVNVHPILSGSGFPVSPDVDPFYRDAFHSDLKLPSFEPGYPAFFILITLVSLTTLSLFVLLFLCCIHPQKTASKIPPNSLTPSTEQTEGFPEYEDEYEDDVEEIYIPEFIDAATSPFPDMVDEEAVEESDDTVVIEAEDAEAPEAEDTVVIEAEDTVVIEAEDTVVIEAEETVVIEANDASR
ncbi:unnamed protein product [Allacma fusca]|uniref:Uncharacterized protein n=1 Tax=Allacma fusca TaxID=39272 RepID=A0A8J2KIF4_9HEXA|nr:unnamed protein product [Allacma fusca]